MYKIVIDKYIPFLEGVFDGIGDVVRKSPEEFTPAAVMDADVLIVRTRTRCDSSLLDGSSVKFIATATIGYDHIDTDYCKSHGISWVSCPGCNAQAVCDYMEEALRYCEQVMRKKFRSIGVVGAGNVGSLVVQMARNKGMRVVVCDPLRNDEGFVSFPMESIAECDVVSFHTPLTHDGESRYPTYRLCDEAFLSGCKRDALIINAARGGIVDEKALLESGRKCVIDCWEGEPHINKELLLSRNTLLASYHIAGYSAQGKWNASQKCADAVYKWAGISENPNLQPLGKAEGDNERGWLVRVSEQLKVMPDAFEKLRQNYVLR